MAETMVPVQIDAGAAAFVEEMGMSKELEQMIEHAQHNTRGLRGIQVTREDYPDLAGNGPEVFVWVCRDVPPEGVKGDRTNWDYAAWQVATFPPEVCFHIGMAATYGAPDER